MGITKQQQRVSGKSPNHQTSETFCALNLDSVDRFGTCKSYMLSCGPELAKFGLWLALSSTDGLLDLA